jgi:hypothetical protein
MSEASETRRKALIFTAAERIAAPDRSRACFLNLR